MQKRNIMELGIKEYLFQELTTPEEWTWEYYYDDDTEVLTECNLIDENGNILSSYDGLKCCLLINGTNGTAVFNTNAPIRKIQRFILKWIEKLESHPEKSWSSEFKLYQFKNNLPERVEGTKYLPEGFNWYTVQNQTGKYSWLESSNGNVICEYDFDKGTYYYERKWREIKHEEPADFREYIEKKTSRKYAV